MPAIFLADGRREELVNHQTRGGYVVVDRLGRGFVLREGRETAKVRNKGYGKAPATSIAMGGAK